MRKAYGEVRKTLNHTQSLGERDHLMQSSIICGDDRYEEQRKPTQIIL